MESSDGYKSAELKRGDQNLAPSLMEKLVAPARDFCLFFIRDPKSVMVAPTVLTQLWYCTEQGIPTQLKNTRRLDYESAHETWNELLSNDWELVEHQINAAA